MASNEAAVCFSHKRPSVNAALTWLQGGRDSGFLPLVALPSSTRGFILRV